MFKTNNSKRYSLPFYTKGVFFYWIDCLSLDFVAAIDENSVRIYVNFLVRLLFCLTVVLDILF